MTKRLCDFSAPPRQLSLFDAPSALAEKHAAVVQSLDRIKHRYGKKTIRKGIRYYQMTDDGRQIAETAKRGNREEPESSYLGSVSSKE